jgi:hypothetical protein
MTASRARGGRQYCRPEDIAGQQCRRLRNGMGCTTPWAQGGRRCCMLENGVVGLGMAPAWLMTSLARVREGGSA